MTGPASHKRPSVAFLGVLGHHIRMAAGKAQQKPGTPRILNRRARHNFHILEVLECGMELLGTEIKSLRAGAIRIDESHARLRNGEVYLVGANIATYPQAAAASQHDPDRPRRLLVRRRQIAALAAHLTQKGHTLVPLAIYFKRGWAKCELGLAVGKRSYDKRETLRKRDQQRDIDRELGRRSRRK